MQVGKDWTLKLLVGVALCLFLGIIYTTWQLYGPKKATSPALVEPDTFLIESVTPNKLVKDTTQPNIILNFNLPVEADHVQEYFDISPKVNGKFTQLTEKRVIFKPDAPWKLGSRIDFRIREGLASKNGKKLLLSRDFSFFIDNGIEGFTFNIEDWSGKFMGFAAANGIKLTAKTGTMIENPTARLYKATPDMLLSHLVYENGQYKENIVDTTAMQVLKTFDNLTTQPEIQYSGPVGLYLLQGLENNTPVTQVWLTLNQTGIHLRQDDQFVYLAAQDLTTQTPTSDVIVKFYQLEKQVKLLQQSNLSTIQKYPWVYPQKLDLVVGQKGQEILIVPVSVPNSQAEIRVYQNLATAHEVFLYTDRPVYRFGDRVSFRGIIRSDNDALYQLPRISKIRVGGEELPSQIVQVGPGGIFSGDFILPASGSAQTNYLYANTDLEAKDYWSGQGQTYFDVFNYVKPDFGLDIKLDKNELIRGNKLTAQIKGTYFDGRPLSNKKVLVNIYRRDYYETERATYNSSFKLNGWGGMCGGGFGQWDEYYGEAIGGTEREVELNAQGVASLDFESRELAEGTSHEITVLAFANDNNNNKIQAAQTAKVHQGEFNIFLRPGASQIWNGQTFSLVGYIEDLNGKPVSDKEIKYFIPKLLEGTTTSDSQGNIKIEIKPTISKSASDNFVLETRDTLGNTIKANKYVFYSVDIPKSEQFSLYSNPASQTILKIVSPVSNLTVDKAMDLEIESPGNLQVLLTFDRGRIYDPQWLELKPGKNTISFPVLNYYAPSITPTFSFFWQGQYYIEGLSLNVPALKQVITTEISTDKLQYKLGDTALVTVVTKNAQGDLISARIGLGIVDKAIFALRKNATPPLHSSLYYYRPRSTNSSSSLTWIASFDWAGGRGGGGGGGAESLNKDADTLYWNTNLQTGNDGRLTVAVPVGNTKTTWKALGYASTDDSKFGQGEIEFLVTD